MTIIHNLSITQMSKPHLKKYQKKLQKYQEVLFNAQPLTLHRLLIQQTATRIDQMSLTQILSESRQKLVHLLY